MMIREKMLIGGNWVDAGDREVLEVVNLPLKKSSQLPTKTM